jgi:hypothetical protein
MNVDVVLFSAGTEISWLRFVRALDTLRITQRPIAKAVGLDRLDALQAIAKLWRHHSVRADTPTGPYSGTYREFSLANFEQPLTILALVDRFSAYHCSDARDHIFALYSLAPDIQPAEREQVESHDKRRQAIYMDINYSADVQQIYHSFALACIKNGSASIVLEAAASRQNSLLPEGWRSWVPDWRTQRSPAAALYHHNFDAISCKLVSPDVLRLSTSHFRCKGHSGACPATVVTTAVIGDAASFDTLLAFLTDLIQCCPNGILEPLLWKVLDKSDAYGFDISPLREYCSDTQTPPAGWAEQKKRFVQTFLHSMDDQCLFVATALSHLSELETHVGFGNVNMQSGDKLVVTSARTSLHVCQGTDHWPVLILRPVRGGTGNDGFAHRLIGTGYMSPPIEPDRPCSGAQISWMPVENVIHVV